jgi:hydroxyethylthiazole kinase-like uncharacterized protein yjeF
MTCVDHEPIELLDVAQMGEADRLAIAGGVGGLALMEAAGAALAQAALAALGACGGGRVVVLCGPGNNGGDGFVAARLLREAGAEVVAGLMYDRSGLKGDARAMAEKWSGRTTSAALVDYSGVSLVIDAIFGAGLSRDVDGRARSVIERLNGWRAETGGFVLAADVPSGLDGNTGRVRGVAVEADETMTFFRLKPGHLLLPGRALCGAVRRAEIGIPTAVLDEIRPQTFRNAPGLWSRFVRPPAASDHKYTRGHVLVVSGPMHRTGAARLAARGALRGGAGLVTLASPREALAVNAAQLTAIMLAPCDGAQELAGLLADPRMNALVVGPGAGVGEALREMVLAALAGAPAGRAIVLDADALTAFASAPERLFAAVRGSAAEVVLTPHDGEFSRLFKSEGEDSHVMSEDFSRLDRARAGARLSGALVLLKGGDSVVAAPDGRAAILSDAPPHLATAGSGDVLAGIIAGVLAARPAQARASGAGAFEAVCAGAWLHGAAGRACGPGLIAEDLPEALPRVFRDLWGDA